MTVNVHAPGVVNRVALIVTCSTVRSMHLKLVNVTGRALACFIEMPELWKKLPPYSITTGSLAGDAGTLSGDFLCHLIDQPPQTQGKENGDNPANNPQDTQHHWQRPGCSDWVKEQPQANQDVQHAQDKGPRSSTLKAAHEIDDPHDENLDRQDDDKYCRDQDGTVERMPQDEEACQDPDYAVQL